MESIGLWGYERKFPVNPGQHCSWGVCPSEKELAFADICTKFLYIYSLILMKNLYEIVSNIPILQMKKLGLIEDKNWIETWIFFIQNPEFISPYHTVS